MSFWADVPENFLKDAIQHWARALFGAAGLQIRVKHIDVDRFDCWVERSIHREETGLQNEIFFSERGANEREACIRLFAALVFPE